MNAESLRAFLLKLPHVVETMQWGGKLVLWAGDKAVGGKMFAIFNLDGDGRSVIAYAAGPERYADLLEVEGIFPAPYLARAHWVAIERWDVFRPKQWEEELRAACDLTLHKLPPRTRTVLELPSKELRQLIAERRKLLEAQAAGARKPAPKTAPDSRRRARETKDGTRRSKTPPAQ